MQTKPIHESDINIRIHENNFSSFEPNPNVFLSIFNICIQIGSTIKFNLYSIHESIINILYIMKITFAHLNPTLTFVSILNICIQT